MCLSVGLVACCVVWCCGFGLTVAIGVDWFMFVILGLGGLRSFGLVLIVLFASFI